jgi:predicted  nucleic acid-binding Zn-ribbon protein
MFKAVSRYFRALGYLLTGQISKATDTLNTSPTVISANYDRIISDKRQRLTQYKDAVAAMIAQEESKKEKLRALTEEMGKLEKLKSGAAAKAKSIVEKYAGDPAAVKNDPEYLRCQSAFKDFSSTLTEKAKRVSELEEDLKVLVNNASGHKNQIMALMRELEKLKEEKHDAVADILSATEEKQIADMMTGISNDRTSEELRELREIRQKSAAGAKISRELAGLDTKRAENEFMEYAQSHESDNEFDQLIGLAGKKDTAQSSSVDVKVPEA